MRRSLANRIFQPWSLPRGEGGWASSLRMGRGGSVRERSLSRFAMDSLPTRHLLSTLVMMCEYWTRSFMDKPSTLALSTYVVTVTFSLIFAAISKEIDGLQRIIKSS